MRILVLTQYFWPENFRINDVVAGLAERGHDVVVSTGLPNYPSGSFHAGYGWNGPYREAWRGIEVRRVPLIPRGGSGGLRLALNYFSHALCASLDALSARRGSFDAILVFEPSPVTIGIPARVLKLRIGAPLLFWVQDLWPESLSATGAATNRGVLSLVGRLVRWIYRGCDRVLVQSRAFISPVAAQGVPLDRIAYLPNSAEDFYRCRAPLPEDPEATEMPPGFRVLFAGNIGAAQDFPTILEAAERLREEPHIRWIIIGDGRMKSWVESQIKARSLQDTVCLLPSRSPEAMPACFSHADLMLATLRRDPIFAYTIPSKIQSYLACGKAVVAALEGEGAQVVVESGAGWAVPPENPRALADAVLAASRLSKDEIGQMGRRGEAYFRQHFERGLLLSRLEGIIASAVDEHNGAARNS